MSLDADDISRLYAEHAVELTRFFARQTLQAEVAVDLVAETFAQAFAGRSRFRGSGDRDALAWIFGIGRHLLGKYYRRGLVERRALARLGLELDVFSGADYERVEEIASLRSQRAALAEGLAQLSLVQREALRLRIVEERSYPELAQRLGISEQSARARVSRGLRVLAEATDRLDRRPHHA
ncbi:MAG: RNA polymerase sigma factor [Solirubrobacteraceae bacterium]